MGVTTGVVAGIGLFTTVVTVKLMLFVLDTI